MESFLNEEYQAETEMELLRDLVRETQRLTDTDGLEQAEFAERLFFTRWLEESFLGDPEMFLQTGHFTNGR